jgi:hypothetical protein
MLIAQFYYNVCNDLHIFWVPNIVFHLSSNFKHDVNLIHLALLQHEKMLVKIEIAQIVRGGGTGEG